ncbi:MAG: hypothetical protein JWQ20_3712, partial [Conexibacter sp.]|nr:hypothetical protein [Conexibacter sp.]
MGSTFEGVGSGELYGVEGLELAGRQVAEGL